MKCCQKNHIFWFSNEFIKGMTHFFQITVAQQSVLLFVFLLENGRNIKGRTKVTTKAVYYERKNPKAEIWIYSDSNEPT